MAKTRTQRPKKKYFFVDSDRYLPKDAFSHKTYVETLKEAVVNAETPLCIGIFGSWGVGKTFIANRLLEVLRKTRNIEVVFFDVWKYRGDSLRREFLLKISDQLCRKKVLSKQFTEELKRDAYLDITEIIKEKLRFSSARVKKILIILGLVMTLPTLVASLVFKFFGWPGVSALLVIIIGTDASYGKLILDKVLGALGGIFIIEPIQATRSKLDSPELFEDKFKKIVSIVKKRGSTLAVIIDNLDRCSDKKVAEVLSTIKTFLDIEGCIYLVPCDDQAIVRHIMKGYPEEKSENDARSFLRKFFQATIRIDPLIEEDVVSYIKDLLKESILPSTEEVEVVIISAGLSTPRRIKQFVNILTSRYLLAKRSLGEKPVKENIGLLAKLTLLEEEWNNLYAAIQEDLRTMDALDEFIRTGTKDEEFIGLLKKIEADTKLIYFLRATDFISHKNTYQFINIKIPSTEAFRGARELPSLLIGRQIKSIEDSIYKKKIPPEKFLPFSEKLLKKEVKGMRFIAAFNILAALIELYPRVFVKPPKIRTSASFLIINNGARPELIKKIPTIKPSDTFTVLRNAPPKIKSKKDTIITEIINSLSQDQSFVQSLKSSFLDAIIENHNLLNASHIEKVKKLLLEKVKQNQQFEEPLFDYYEKLLYEK